MAGVASQRRKGKSVVFEMLPSFVTPESPDEESLRPRRSPAWTAKLSRETIREIVMVIAGLALVVWLFFGGDEDVNSPNGELKLAGRPILRTSSPFIIPAHSGTTSSRDGVKKAPGDRNAPTIVEKTPDKSGRIPLYQYTGKDVPSVVLVTVIDDTKYPRDYCDKIIRNRIDYATAHGYGVLIRYVTDFQKFIDETENHPPSSWTRVPLAREALASFTETEWFWYVDQTEIIMDPRVNVIKDIVSSDALAKNMKREFPIIRGSMDVRTSKRNTPEDVSIVLYADEVGVTSTSFLYRNSNLAKAWLEFWIDPIQRNYPRFADETASLQHMLQWHQRFLLGTAVINARQISSTVYPPYNEFHDELAYVDGDFTALIKCDFANEACKRDFQKYWNLRLRVANNPSVSESKPEGQDPAQAKAQLKAQANAQAQAEKKVQQEEAAAEAQAAEAAEAYAKAGAQAKGQTITRPSESATTMYARK